MKPTKIPKVQDVMITSEHLTVSYDDGRGMSLPLNWYPRLNRATPAQRRNWRLIGKGQGIHWPDVDEDLGAEGLLLGRPSREYAQKQGRRRTAHGATVVA